MKIIEKEKITETVILKRPHKSTNQMTTFSFFRFTDNVLTWPLPVNTLKKNQENGRDSQCKRSVS